MKATLPVLLIATLASSSITYSVEADAAVLNGKDTVTLNANSGVNTNSSRISARAENRVQRVQIRAERRQLRRVSEVEPQEPVLELESVIKAPSRGIFHSAGLLTANSRSGAIRTGINDQDFVSGSLVRIEWATINRAPGEYDFTIIENELTKATAVNASISLAVLDSLALPDFVLNQCETFTYQFRGTDILTCLPWDDAYQAYKAELLTALGAAFDSHPNLSGVYFTYAAMTNGVEMHWRVDESAFARAGYTEARLLNSYNTIMDMYNNAFPTTSIIMEVHEVFQSSSLAENAFDYCQDTMGSRCGVAIWWCSSRMATNPRESEYGVYHVAQQATELSFAVCQTIGSFTDSPNRFDAGAGWTTEEAFLHEMSFFISEGFRNFEIWTNDITNPQLTDIIREQVLPAFNE